MKATGIVRRIDDLGRVVIPKEIRRTLRIREGDPLEIYTDKDGEVVLRKYSSIVGELSEFGNEYAEALYQSTGFPTVVTDRDTITSVAGVSKKDFEGKNISPELDKIIKEMKMVNINSETNFIPIAAEGNQKTFAYQIIQPVIHKTAPIGAVIICSNNKAKPFTQTEITLVQAAADFLGKQMEQ